MPEAGQRLTLEVEPHWGPGHVIPSPGHSSGDLENRSLWHLKKALAWGITLGATQKSSVALPREGGLLQMMVVEVGSGQWEPPPDAPLPLLLTQLWKPGSGSEKPPPTP